MSVSNSSKCHVNVNAFFFSLTETKQMRTKFIHFAAQKLFCVSCAGCVCVLHDSLHGCLSIVAIAFVVVGVVIIIKIRFFFGMFVDSRCFQQFFIIIAFFVVLQQFTFGFSFVFYNLFTALGYYLSTYYYIVGFLCAQNIIFSS